jgi:TolB-like protein
MRNLILAGAAFLFCSVIAYANPTTMPTDSKSVLVFPFSALNDQPATWIGKGIQQNLMADLGRLPGVRVLPRGDEQSVNATRAIELAKEAGAAYVVTGSYQLMNDELRCVGQIINVASGDIVGTLKTTGAMHELFALEDAISDQAARQLWPVISANRPAAAPMGNPPVINPTPPLQQDPMAGRYIGSSLQAWLETSVNSRDYYHRYIFGQSPTYRDYGYDYPYGYGYGRGYGYGLGYPLYGHPFGGFGRVIIIKSGRSHHHGHDGHDSDSPTPTNPLQPPQEIRIVTSPGQFEHYQARPMFGNALQDSPRNYVVPQFRNYAEFPRMSVRNPQRNYATQPRNTIQPQFRNYATQPPNVARSQSSNVASPR